MKQRCLVDTGDVGFQIVYRWMQTKEEKDFEKMGFNLLGKRQIERWKTGEYLKDEVTWLKLDGILFHKLQNDRKICLFKLHSTIKSHSTNTLPHFQPGMVSITISSRPRRWQIWPWRDRNRNRDDVGRSRDWLVWHMSIQNAKWTKMSGLVSRQLNQDRDRDVYRDETFVLLETISRPRRLGFISFIYAIHIWITYYICQASALRRWYPTLHFIFYPRHLNLDVS